MVVDSGVCIGVFGGVVIASVAEDGVIVPDTLVASRETDGIVATTCVCSGRQLTVVITRKLNKIIKPIILPIVFLYLIAFTPGMGTGQTAGDTSY